MIKPYYQHNGTEIYRGDCLDILKAFLPDSIDSIVTDPPYGLGFMGKDWDHGIPGKAFWAEALRIAKPGAFLLAFGGTRTFHRLTCAIEDAGWEIRDCVMWIYGTGFPKSLDISKAIDKAAGAERQIVDASHRWDGWGTALKPAWEPIIVAMKPLDGTFAENALKHGVAGLNIDECRIGTENTKCNKSGGGGKTFHGQAEKPRVSGSAFGRWPANVIHDGSEEVIAGFPEKTGGGFGKRGTSPSFGPATKNGGTMEIVGFGDQGSAARFFYCAKANQSERGEKNNHPTVKPLSLMKYLINLVKMPTGGIILDPFMGSGSTLLAAKELGREAIGIETEKEYCKIAIGRLGQGFLELKGPE